MTTRLVFVLALGACTGVRTNPGIDAPPPDMPDDGPNNKSPHRYVMDKHVIPQTSNQARESGLDVNGDQTIDNQLGLVIATLAGQGFEVQPPADVAVDRGAVLVLVDLQSDGFTAGAATFTLFAGANPQPPACTGGADTVCRRHLDGTASFDVETGSPRDTPLAGAFAGGTLVTDVADAGRLHIEVAFGTTTPVALTLLAARAKVTSASEAGIATGVVGGGIAKTEIDTVVLPAWQVDFDAAVQRDCNGTPPTCGCVVSSQGKTMHDLFDTTPNDCAISLSELQNNNLVKSLLAPDLTISGQQALSFGVAFSAVRATYTP